MIENVTKCIAPNQDFYFNVFTAPNFTDPSNFRDFGVKLYHYNDSSATISTQCQIITDFYNFLRCNVTENGVKFGKYYPVMLADTLNTCAFNLSESNINLTKYYKSARFVRIESYPNISSSQTNPEIEFDYSKKGPFTFYIDYESDFVENQMPAIEANGKILSCSIAKAKQLECSINKEDFPEFEDDGTTQAYYKVYTQITCDDKKVDTNVTFHGKTPEIIEPPEPEALEEASAEEPEEAIISS